MDRASRFLMRALAAGLVFTLFVNPLAHSQVQEPSAGAASAVNQDSQDRQSQVPGDEGTSARPTSEAPAQPDDSSLPDSPGSVQSQAPAASTQQSPPPQATPQQPPSQPQKDQQQGAHEPLGTAAAESIPTSGNAASRPAGAALAPAKQKRVRSLLIKVGALVAVGVAIGATMALSQGSPSKPPGSN